MRKKFYLSLVLLSTVMMAASYQIATIDQSKLKDMRASKNPQSQMDSVLKIR